MDFKNMLLMLIATAAANALLYALLAVPLAWIWNTVMIVAIPMLAPIEWVEAWLMLVFLALLRSNITLNFKA